MSQVGFYRYKAAPAINKTYKWIVNNLEAGAKEVKVLDTCPGDLILKYLDHNGQYRFYPFSRYYETNDTPQKIGSVNKFLTSILTDQSNNSNVGYKNQRIISATAEANTEQLGKLNDIYTSPRVYLYIGSGTDTAQDWIEIEINAAPAVVKRRKANSGFISVNIVLPEHYTITML